MFARAEPHLRLGGLQHRDGLVERSTRNGVLGHQVTHAGVIVASLHELRLCCDELGARRLQAAFFVLGIEPGQHLAGADGVADLDVALDQPAIDPERFVDFGLCLHRAGEGDGIADGPGLDGRRTDRAHFGRWRFVAGTAGRQQRQRSECEEGSRSGQTGLSLGDRLQ